MEEAALSCVMKQQQKKWFWPQEKRLQKERRNNWAFFFCSFNQATDCMKPGQQAANAPHAKTTFLNEKHNLRIDSCSETSASSSSSYRFPESSEEDSQPAILTTTQMGDQSSTIQNQSSAMHLREFLAKERSVSHDSEELLQITQLHRTPASVTPDVNLSERDRLFEMGVIRARVAVRYFCKLFMKQMEISGYSVWRTLQAIDPDATFSKHEHTAYALESNLNKVCTWKRLMFPHWILQWVLGNEPSSIQLVENQTFSSAHHFLCVLTVEVQYWIIKNIMWTFIGAIPIVCTSSNCVWVISLQLF